MTFTEEWFGEASCGALGRLFKLTDGVEGAIVEVGCWQGRSTIALASACYPLPVHAVDTWQGSPGEISADLAAERDVHAEFLANVAEYPNIEPHRVDWRDYFAANNQPLRFLHIDATHTYEEVRDNIAAALPLLAPGAVICGDDAHHQPVAQAVLEFFPDANRDATLWWHQMPFNDLAGEYRRLCAVPSDIYLHLPRLVTLATELNAQHVIELGTRSGVSTVAWLHALEQTGGHLTSIDIDTRPDIGEYDHWTFVQGDDLAPSVVSALAPADIVFIDTSHLYEHTIRELNVYRWLVKPGGVIVCHDTQLERPEGAPTHPRFPVRTAIEEFTSVEGWEWIEYPDCWGLGVLRCP